MFAKDVDDNTIALKRKFRQPLLKESIIVSAKRAIKTISQILAMLFVATADHTGSFCFAEIFTYLIPTPKKSREFRRNFNLSFCNVFQEQNLSK